MGESFIKGGCGCVIAVVALGLLLVVVGGRFRIDLFGALCLFVVGGLVAAGAHYIYDSGRRQGQRDRWSK